jgi:hypothetical protein
MTEPDYVELHCHSAFSLLDGTAQPEELLRQAQALGMDTLALTDHDNLYGAVRFSMAARGHAIHPLLGVELTLADRTHLTLLAEDRRGCAAREVRLHLEQPDVAPWIDALVLDAPTAQADVLQRALAQLLARAQLAGGVEHLRASCADLRPVVATQLDLFGSRGALERDALVANLVARFGARRFFAAVPQQRDAVLPERRYELLEARRR